MSTGLKKSPSNGHEKSSTSKEQQEKVCEYPMSIYLYCIFPSTSSESLRSGGYKCHYRSKRRPLN